MLLVLFCLLAAQAIAAQPAPVRAPPARSPTGCGRSLPMNLITVRLSPATGFPRVRRGGAFVGRAQRTLARRKGGRRRAAGGRLRRGRRICGGPLASDGSAPDCQAFDRVYVVTDTDLRQYRYGGDLAADLRDWPVGLGAPTYLDLNDDYVWNEGEPLVTSADPARVINLAAGERPDLRGSATAWWVLNDVGNTHTLTGSPPLGLEVQVTAYNRNSGRAAGDPHGTYFRLRLVYRGEVPLTDAWLGFYASMEATGYAGFDSAREVAYFYEPSASAVISLTRAAGITSSAGRSYVLPARAHATPTARCTPTRCGGAARSSRLHRYPGQQRAAALQHGKSTATCKGAGRTARSCKTAATASTKARRVAQPTSCGG